MTTETTWLAAKLTLWNRATVHGGDQEAAAHISFIGTPVHAAQEVDALWVEWSAIF